MWFAALGSYQHNGWLLHLAYVTHRAPFLPLVQCTRDAINRAASKNKRRKPTNGSRPTGTSYCSAARPTPRARCSTATRTRSRPTRRPSRCVRLAALPLDAHTTSSFVEVQTATLLLWQYVVSMHTTSSPAVVQKTAPSVTRLPTSSLSMPRRVALPLRLHARAEPVGRPHARRGAALQLLLARLPRRGRRRRAELRALLEPHARRRGARTG